MRGCRYSASPGTACLLPSAAMAVSELSPRFHSRDNSELPSCNLFARAAGPGARRLAPAAGAPAVFSAATRSNAGQPLAFHSSQCTSRVRSRSSAAAKAGPCGATPHSSSVARERRLSHVSCCAGESGGAPLRSVVTVWRKMSSCTCQSQGPKGGSAGLACTRRAHTTTGFEWRTHQHVSTKVRVSELKLEQLGRREELCKVDLLAHRLRLHLHRLSPARPARVAPPTGIARLGRGGSAGGGVGGGFGGDDVGESLQHRLEPLHQHGPGL
eukprot:scaffold13341_cov101-Isochrysis_galbana.AAC.16